MALVYSGSFQPDIEAIFSISNYGVPFWFQVTDDKGNIVDLTSVTNIELEFKHLTDESVTKITKTCVKSDALNGLAYYISQPNIFSVIGDYSVKPIVYYASDSSFPDGRRIKAYSVSPDKVTMVD